MARSSTLVIDRSPANKLVIQYNATTDEILVGVDNKIMALRAEAMIEAIERRIDDDRYRPITEEQRAKEAPHKEAPSGRRPRR